MLYLLFHSVVVVINCYTLWYDQKYVDIPFPKPEIADFPYKARWFFLTFWCLVTQTLYFFVATLNDIFGTNENHPRRKSQVRRLKDFLFCVAFPLASFVSCMFWSLYFIDKDLIFPEYVSRTVPVWMNHTLHTTILIFMLVELCTSFRQFPSRKTGAFIIIFINIVYTTVLCSIYFLLDVWVYPVFEVLNWPVRILFLSSSFASGYFLYVVCETLNNFVWSKNIAKLAKKH